MQTCAERHASWVVGIRAARRAAPRRDGADNENTIRPSAVNSLGRHRLRLPSWHNARSWPWAESIGFSQDFLLPHPGKRTRITLPPLGLLPTRRRHLQCRDHWLFHPPEKRHRFFQISGVKALGEPAGDRDPLAAPMPRPGKRPCANRAHSRSPWSLKTMTRSVAIRQRSRSPTPMSSRAGWIERSTPPSASFRS